MIGWLIAALAFLGIAAWWARRELLLPWRRVRRVLQQLASGDLNPTPILGGLPVFRKIGRDIEQVAERLRDMNRVASDEGFSLRAILGAMVEGVLIVDSSLRIRLVNPALLKLFKLHRSPLDRTMMEIFRDHSLDAAVRECLANGAPIHRDLEIQGNSPEERHFFEAGIAPMPGWQPGKPLGAIVVFHDLTELKTLESIRQDLVANVSHELRTPLAIIHGYLETLMDGALDDRPTAERFIRVMHKHGERLNRLIEDLLNLSKLESGSAKLQVEMLDLRDLAAAVLERFDSAVTERGAEVTVSFPEDLPEVEGDPDRIDQVLFNLLENAFKYSSAEKTRIEIFASREGDEMVKVSVRDNGPGIPLSDQSHLFERFYRVHKDRNRDAGGTGLGLSIVKHVILAHGGKVGLESMPGEGATFWFTLPVKRSEPG